MNLEHEKIILLDIDNVLNIYPQKTDKYGSVFNENFCNNLKYIIDNTNAKIVIISEWKSSGLLYLKSMWKDRELAGEIIEITPNDEELVTRGLFNNIDDVKRSDEIQYFIDFNNVKNFVILDDDEIDSKKLNENFVKCSGNNHIDSIKGLGLTRKCAKKAIQILNKI
jgi:hypothetical protein